MFHFLPQSACRLNIFNKCLYRTDNFPDPLRFSICTGAMFHTMIFWFVTTCIVRIACRHCGTFCCRHIMPINFYFPKQDYPICLYDQMRSVFCEAEAKFLNIMVFNFTLQILNISCLRNLTNCQNTHQTHCLREWGWGEIELSCVNICRRTSTQKDGDHRLPSLYRITGGTISHVNVRGGSFGNEL